MSDTLQKACPPGAGHPPSSPRRRPPSPTCPRRKPGAGPAASWPFPRSRCSSPASTRRRRSAGRRRLPRRAAAGDGLRLRQQLDATDRARSAPPPAPWSAARPAGQGQRRAPDVPGHRGRRLRDGRRRRHLRRRRGARARAPAPGRAARHGRRPRVTRPTSRLPPRPPPRQRACSPASCAGCSAPHRRHALGLPRVLAPVREELPVVLARVRDRDRAHRARAADAHAGRRGRDRLQGAAAGLGEQAAHVPRRLAHPAHDHAPDAATSGR